MMIMTCVDDALYKLKWGKCYLSCACAFKHSNQNTRASAECLPSCRKSLFTTICVRRSERSRGSIYLITSFVLRFLGTQRGKGYLKSKAPLFKKKMKKKEDTETYLRNA